MIIAAQDQLAPGQRWADLTSRSAPERLTFFKLLLIHLGSSSTLVQEILVELKRQFRVSIAALKAGCLRSAPKRLARDEERMDWLYR